ncbi:acetolactate synthase, large subunit [Tindallia magadiensis]|uniref:Acetolactate synthase n=1 Tax=Tindallia magadiensis TaxID=69895 RepID=A0A1I3FUW0_9FIRM|nr:biosynthetic-type acetolactate synthase large subunit [Tindallia magadiensis]SFI15030.1 acetolactate synthase, large subunit [Tindallia magadiensis]
MRLNGSQILMECLLEHNVDTVFGYPGGAVINIYDAIYEYQDRIKHILTAHEQGASHAADGYARSTGKVGVCIATSGPGATNLVTGIATAYMDSVPMVAITGNVPVALLGKDSFQEVDITGITMPITKHNFIVKNVEDLAKTIRRAFYIAQEGRPGPVLVDIPKDVTVALAEYKKETIKPVFEHTDSICEETLDAVVELINASKKPFVLTGGGVIRSDASQETLELVEKIQSPVASSLMGLGGIPTNHELFTGMIGMHGSKTSNLASSECDLFIAIGSRFSDRITSNIKLFASEANIVHIDIDPAEINKNIQTFYHVAGDVKASLKRLNEKLKEKVSKERYQWKEQIIQWKEQYPLEKNQNGAIKPHYVIRKLSELTSGKAIITTEVGQSQMWSAQYYDYVLPRTFLSSGGLGTMGYGLGASLGAKLGNPDKIVVNIAGDGSFCMNNNELATAVHYHLPVIVLVLDNQALGMVRQWQDLFFDKRFSQTDRNRCTDFIKLAEAYGAKGYRMEKVADVEPILKEALTQTIPVVIHCPIDPDDKVFPMVPPGAAIKDLITEESQG